VGQNAGHAPVPANAVGPQAHNIRSRAQLERAVLERQYQILLRLDPLIDNLHQLIDDIRNDMQ
jgi:hypothetical protein